MKSNFVRLTHIPLAPGASYRHPAAPRRYIDLETPALQVMTDLTQVFAVTTTIDASIDQALEQMKHAGIRLLLVTDEQQEIVGLITANDILGERPVKLAHDTGLMHADLTVGQLMTPQTAIQVLNLVTVSNAQVGHIVRTLHDIARQHALVVEVEPGTGAQVIRGIFSSSEISKRLGYDVSEIMSGARSLAELQHELSPVD